MADIFLIRCLWNGIENFCIWYSDEKCGLFCDEEKKILCFLNKSATLLYLSQNNLCLCQDEDCTAYDFDKLKAWVDSDDSVVNCGDISDIWNMFTDIAYTTGVQFKGDKRTKLIDLIYDKLFFGNNISVIKKITEEKEDFIPDWDKKEIKTIKSVMKDGLNIFMANLKCV